MKTDDTPSIELTPECEARLAQYAREKGITLEEAFVFLLSEGIKHLDEERGPLPGEEQDAE